MNKRDWKPATLGSAAVDGDPITVWCNNRTCGYWLQQGGQYRAVLTAADLARYAEKYDEACTFIEFRARLRCRHCGSGDVSTIVDSHHETPKARWEREASDGE
jgi:hypothetical protein